MSECKAHQRGLTVERLREVLSFDSESGQFVWLVTLASKGVRGSTAGYRMPDGYVRINIDGFNYPAHWLAWMHVHGEWPAIVLDHANGVRDDNRIANLRGCSRSENQQNKPQPPNKHAPGVYRTGKRYLAKIRVHGVGRLYLGSFATPQDASAAYEAAKRQYHPFAPTARAA